MRIGVDIDGVLTNIEQFVIDYISKYCVENKIKYDISDSNYDYCKTFHISKEIEMNFWKRHLEDYAINQKPRPFAAEIIQKLKENHHEIYIITARWLTNQENEMGNKMRQIVKNWLYENKISYNKLIFSKATKEQKIEEVIKHKIDIMIEDSPNNINQLANIIPVICYHAEYNKNCVGDKIIRCYSWYDIYHKIMNMNQTSI